MIRQFNTSNEARVAEIWLKAGRDEYTYLPQFQALVQYARKKNRTGLELYTHQQNSRACNFYEKLGFEAVKYGISPPPESVPDVAGRS